MEAWVGTDLGLNTTLISKHWQVSCHGHDCCF